MSTDIYIRLAKHLNTLPVAFPATETGVEIRILERWFTPQEASIALGMSGIPSSPEDLGARLGIPAADLTQALDAMVDKGLIFRLALPNKRLYNLVPLAEGMWEFRLNTSTPEDIQLLFEYRDTFMEKGWYGTPTTQHRVIPISTSLNPDLEIMSYDRAEEIIRAQSKIALITCICRKESRAMGKGCDHLPEACLAFGTGAYFYLQTGRGREISQEEALDVLRRGMEEGLVIQPGNGQKIWSICLCCPCCCALLKALRAMEKPGRVAHSSFFAGVLDADCTACGICAEKCPMGAITIQDTARIDRERCIGCGVCVGTCAWNALELKPKPEPYVPPADMTAMHMQIAKERGLI